MALPAIMNGSKPGETWLKGSTIVGAMCNGIGGRSHGGRMRGGIVGCARGIVLVSGCAGVGIVGLGCASLGDWGRPLFVIVVVWSCVELSSESSGPMLCRMSGSSGASCSVSSSCCSKW